MAVRRILIMRTVLSVVLGVFLSLAFFRELRLWPTLGLVALLLALAYLVEALRR